MTYSKISHWRQSKYSCQVEIKGRLNKDENLSIELHNFTNLMPRKITKANFYI